MKGTLRYQLEGRTVERDVNYIHNFENGVWMYRCNCLKDIKQDFSETLEKCIRIDESKIKWSLMQRFVRSVVKVFTPMM